MLTRGFRPKLGKGMIVPAVILGLTASYLVEALRIGPAFNANGVPEAAFFPLFLAGATFVAMVPIVIRALSGGEEAADAGTASMANPALFMVVSALYVFAFSRIGYVAATLLYSYALISIFRFGNGATLRGQAYRIAASLSITLVVYLFFNVIFKVRLPTFMEGL